MYESLSVPIFSRLDNRLDGLSIGMLLRERKQLGCNLQRCSLSCNSNVRTKLKAVAELEYHKLAQELEWLFKTEDFKRFFSITKD